MMNRRLLGEEIQRIVVSVELVREDTSYYALTQNVYLIRVVHALGIWELQEKINRL